MNRIGQLSVGVCLLLVSTLSAKEYPVKSQIDRVTVFTQGAQIFRSSTATLEKGKHIVVLKGLSPVLNHSTIQVGGTGDLTILSVSPRTNYLELPDKKEKEEKLQEQLDIVKDEIAHGNALINVYSEEHNLLLANKNLGGQQTGVDIEQLKQAAEFFRSRLAEIETKKIELNAKMKDLRERERQLQYELNQVTNARGKSTTEIWVTVDVASSTKAKFAFDYTVRNAGWEPYYDVRLEDYDKPIALNYKAKVIQRTGVDWNNVSLTLSSGNPQKNSVLPNLYPWYINFQQLNVRGARAESYSSEMQFDAEELDEVVLEDAPAPASTSAGAVPMKTATAVFKQRVTNFEYAVSNRYSITSSNNVEDVFIRALTVDALFEYRANVRLDKTAYLMAKLYDWHNFNLLNGSAKLFNQGTFVGETYLNVENTADTLLVSMGRDESIVITRERVLDKTGTQSLGGNTKVSRFWQIDMRNTKQSAIQLVVTDQIPISRQKDIQVKLEEAEGARFSEKTGFLTWKIKLNYGENQAVQYGYSVKYPKDRVVNLPE